MPNYSAFFCCKNIAVRYFKKTRNVVIQTERLGTHYFVKFISAQKLEGIVLFGNHFMTLLAKSNSLHSCDLNIVGQTLCVEACVDTEIGRTRDCKKLFGIVKKFLENPNIDETEQTVICQNMRELNVVPAAIVPEMKREPHLQRIIWCCRAHFDTQKIIPIKIYDIGQQVYTLSISNVSNRISAHSRFVFLYNKLTIHLLSVLAATRTACVDLDKILIAAVNLPTAGRLPLELYGCATCHRETVAVCVCGLIYYCGPVCRLKHLSIHRPMCIKIPSDLKIN